MSTSLPSFANEPLAELRRAAAREELLEGLRWLDQRLPLRVPVWIGTERREGEQLHSTDPGAPERVVANAAEASAQDVSLAVATAARGLERWASTPVTERAAALLRAAAWMREQRPRLAALVVRECGKPWPEADADVCEAIDFLEYYARGALALAAGRELLQAPGERNGLRYAPRGIVAAISPWNFPLAIPTGMVAAALATGNAALLKPAEQAPLCGLMIVEALRDAGVPPAAIALLPGGGEVGAALVRDPGVHAIAFTGSGAVGLEILRAAAETPPAQGHIKRVIAEMGGKNCVIVDADADLDEAIPGIVRSAFAYAGQKCSAASRVLVHEALAGVLLERLGGAVEVLVVGQAQELGTEVGPLIDREAQQRVEGYCAAATAAGRIVAERGALPDTGWFCAPAVVTDLPPDAPVLREEVFGPLLTVEPVAGVEQALERVRELPFALTGGLYARNPRTVARVIERSPVGNLYVNRPITGAMVGRQPFGGNRRSGVGAKAGGPDYLLQFVEERVVCENTVRHGLVI